MTAPANPGADMMDSSSTSSNNPFHRAVYLTGATASGKTAVGIALAQLLDAEILALDSMTLYRGMDVGTAKPSLEERRGIPHHLIDKLEPWESASVARYRDWARQAVLDVESRGRLALFVGGTPLYLKALLRGLFEGPGSDAGLRERLEAEAEKLGRAALHARLARSDPDTAARLHPNDLRRVVRALEVLELSGRPLSEHQSEHDQPAPLSVPVFALGRPRALVHQRINQRVDQMIDSGWIEEVRELAGLKQPLHSVPAQAVGYQELLSWVGSENSEQRESLTSVVERIKARTRQFAKRQETWFRNLKEVRTWPIADHETPELIATVLARSINSPQHDSRDLP